MSATSPTRTPNRLAHETSPYLQQHARNPVDWYPWGTEAFETARRLDRPIFLSVGYSACHWCHVMEHESFENDEIADILNRNFLAIKVDREERPDVDQIYMTAVQLMTRRGGWPMSVFLTPDGEPFYGGTYWPPTSRMGMPGFRDILLKLADVWKTQRHEALDAGMNLSEAIRRVSAQEFDAVALNEDLLKNAVKSLLASADRTHGGFGGAPKFPHAMDVRLLLRCARRFGDDDALSVAHLTLDKMAAGGMYDQLGGGFHRYSTDDRWLVPHFEKMLYDNALLAPAYVEAWQVANASGDHAAAEACERVVRETLDYVLREMTQPKGGFYSTQDADSEGEEGKFFIWTHEEVLDVLGPEDGRVFCEAYDVHPRGNWEGRSILNRPRDDRHTAERVGLTVGALRELLDRSRQKLLAARERRVPPGRDDKIITAWNGLMIAALSLAGRALDEQRYIAAATAAAEFLLVGLRTDEGRLLHSYKDARAQLPACLDDCACLADGLVELYQATFEPRWLAAAVEAADEMLQHFADPTGDFFYTADDHEKLIARTKDMQDNATPSGNSMAATALLKLGRLTGRSDLEEAGYNTLVSMSGLLSEHPGAAAQAMIALDLHLGPTRELAIVDGSSPEAGDALLQSLGRRFLPRVLVIRRPAGETDARLPDVLQPVLEGKEPADRTQFFVCERGSCRAPVATEAEVLALLDAAP